MKQTAGMGSRALLLLVARLHIDLCRADSAICPAGCYPAPAICPAR